MPAPGEQDKHQIGGGGQHRAGHHHFHQRKTLREQAAQKAAGNRHNHAEGFHRGGDFFFAEAHILIKHIGNHTGHNIRNAVKAD